MRHVQRTPRMDMIPMMGPCAVLIPMVLMAWTPPVGLVETNLPAL